MTSKQRYLSWGVALTFVSASVITASPATAECSNAGYATVCAQGTVRGGGPTPPSVGYPSYCADPWYCDDDWNMDIGWDPGIEIGGPGVGLPGRPGGIGPRR